MKPIMSSARVLLPSLLVASLALSACNDTAKVQQTELGTTTDTSDVGAENNDQTTADITNNAATTEQAMIDNLDSYRWSLASAMDSNNQPITALTAIKDQVMLNFDSQSQNNISYNVSCNTISAVYELQGQMLSVKDGMSTKMSCGKLDAVENELNELMQGDSTISLTTNGTPSLTQVTSNAVTLVWSGKMTAQAKDNSKGDTVFWAIDAQSKPCSDNNAQLCLQIRPVTYDEQGIKTEEGEVVEFAGVIDGYEHNDTHNEVVRLQRFKTDVDSVLVDNIDSEYAYVLDMVIESSAVK